jgi:hypothetical protein
MDEETSMVKETSMERWQAQTASTLLAMLAAAPLPVPPGVQGACVAGIALDMLARALAGGRAVGMAAQGKATCVPNANLQIPGCRLLHHALHASTAVDVSATTSCCRSGWAAPSRAYRESCTFLGISHTATAPALLQAGRMLTRQPPKP